MSISHKIRIPLSLASCSMPGPGEWLHSALAVLFLWLAPGHGLLTPHSPALRQAPGLGPILLARSAGVTVSWRTVGCQRSGLPGLFQDIGDQEMSGPSQSHKIVLLGQNPVLEASFRHELQAICSKMCVQHTETLLPQEVHWRCKGCAEQAWGSMIPGQWRGLSSHMLTDSYGLQLAVSLCSLQRSHWSPVNPWLHHNNHNS